MEEERERLHAGGATNSVGGKDFRKRFQKPIFYKISRRISGLQKQSGAPPSIFSRIRFCMIFFFLKKKLSSSWFGLKSHFQAQVRVVQMVTEPLG